MTVTLIAVTFAPLAMLLAPILWRVFRGTWRQLDAEALDWRRSLAEKGEVDRRPLLALTMVALTATLWGALVCGAGIGAFDANWP